MRNLKRYEHPEPIYKLGNGLDENSEKLIDKFGLTYYTTLKQVTYDYLNVVTGERK